MTELTVRNLLDLFLEHQMITVSIWSNDAQNVVYEGVVHDIPLEYQSALVDSIDPPAECALTINIE